MAVVIMFESTMQVVLCLLKFLRRIAKILKAKIDFGAKIKLKLYIFSTDRISSFMSVSRIIPPAKIVM